MTGTRERIVDTALESFNARGTQAVSTNHISEAMGISPGNLYYHFSNKEEIIRAIYERAIADYDVFLGGLVDSRPDPVTMLAMLEGVFAHQWRYRFLQREFPALIRRDEILCVRYREMQERRVAFYRELGRHWIDTGSLRPMPEQELDDLVMAIWLVGDTWLAYVEAMGRSEDPDEVGRGPRLLHSLLRPHLSPEAADACADGTGCMSSPGFGVAEARRDVVVP